MHCVCMYGNMCVCMTYVCTCVKLSVGVITVYRTCIKFFELNFYVFISSQIRGSLFSCPLILEPSLQGL